MSDSLELSLLFAFDDNTHGLQMSVGVVSPEMAAGSLGCVLHIAQPEAGIFGECASGMTMFGGGIEFGLSVWLDEIDSLTLSSPYQENSTFVIPAGIFESISMKGQEMSLKRLLQTSTALVSMSPEHEQYSF